VDPEWRGRDSATFDLAVHWVLRMARSPFFLNVWAHTPHRPVPKLPHGSEQGPGPPLKSRFAWLYEDRAAFNESRFSQGMQMRFARHRKSGYNISVAEGMAAYLGELWGFDYNIGRLLSAIDAIGVRNETLVLFSSDHGPESTRNAELGSTGLCRGSKQELTEGSIRLPYIVRWPGCVPAGGVDASSVIANIDWFPTLARLAAVAPNALPPLDGIDISGRFCPPSGLLGAKLSASARRPRESGGAVWTWPAGRKVRWGNGSASQSLRAGGGLKAWVQFKKLEVQKCLHRDKVCQGEVCVVLLAVYDVARDPGEHLNLHRPSHTFNRSRLLARLQLGDVPACSPGKSTRVPQHMCDDIMATLKRMKQSSTNESMALHGWQLSSVPRSTRSVNPVNGEEIQGVLGVERALKRQGCRFGDALPTVQPVKPVTSTPTSTSTRTRTRTHEHKQTSAHTHHHTYKHPKGG